MNEITAEFSDNASNSWTLNSTITFNTDSRLEVKDCYWQVQSHLALFNMQNGIQHHGEQQPQAQIWNLVQTNQNKTKNQTKPNQNKTKQKAKQTKTVQQNVTKIFFNLLYWWIDEYSALPSEQ